VKSGLLQICTGKVVPSKPAGICHPGAGQANIGRPASFSGISLRCDGYLIKEIQMPSRDDDDKEGGQEGIVPQGPDLGQDPCFGAIMTEDDPMAIRR